MTYILDGRQAANLQHVCHTGRVNEDNLIPGGKSLTGGRTHSPMINVRVPADTKTRIDELARAAGMGTSKYVRQIIDEHLAQLDAEVD